MYFPLFVGVLCLSLFCYALLCVHSSFAIILKRKRKLVALLFLSYRCITINVLWLFLTVLWAGLQCVTVVFPDHTHLLFGSKNNLRFSAFLFLSAVILSCSVELSMIFSSEPVHPSLEYHPWC